MADERDTSNDAIEKSIDPKRPPPARGQRASTLAPQPGGFVLESRPAPAHETQQPPPQAQQPYVAMAHSAEQGTENATQPSQSASAPAAPAQDESWRRAVDAHIPFWMQTEARYRAALEEAATLDAPTPLLEACANGRSVAASGLLLALASDACLTNPSPQNRRALIDMRPNILTYDDAVAGFLALPADRLAGKVLDYLDSYRTDFAAHALEMLPVVERAVGLEPVQHGGERDDPLTPSPDVSQSAELRDQEAPRREQADRVPASEPEYDWRAAAFDAARHLLDEAQSSHRSAEQEMPVSEHEHAEATREQTDARRDRLAGDFQRAAREVASTIMRPAGRERDDDGGREL